MNSTERVGGRRSAGGLFGLDGDRRAHLLLHMSAIVSARGQFVLPKMPRSFSCSRLFKDTFSRKLAVKRFGPPTHKSLNPVFMMEKMPETRFGGDICVTIVCGRDEKGKKREYLWLCLVTALALKGHRWEPATLVSLSLATSHNYHI